MRKHLTSPFLARCRKRQGQQEGKKKGGEKDEKRGMCVCGGGGLILQMQAYLWVSPGKVS